MSGSPRKGGNSDSLCDQFMRGAEEVGHEVEKIWIQGKNIAPCVACYYCKDHKGECAIKDDMKEVLDKMIAEVKQNFGDLISPNRTTMICKCLEYRFNYLRKML